MTNLIPTPVVDKNGKLTTVRKKVVTAHSSISAIPVVNPPAPDVSKAELLSAMMEVFGVSATSSSSQFFSVQIERWLDSSTPEQLAELGVVLDALGPLDGFDDDTDDPVVKRERAVIRGIMNETIQNRTHQIHAHDMLAVRSALCSDYSRENKLPTKDAFPYFIGLISKNGRVLPPYQRLTREELISATRFAYEVVNRNPSPSSIPVHSAYVESTDDRGDVKTIFAAEYKSAELVELVTSNPDRVGELIELAETRKSCDPSLLKELLNSEVHKAMNPGWL